MYNDNTIVKLYFSNDTGKNVPMKTFKKWLSIFQNTFTKLYLEKQHWNRQKKLKSYCTKTTLLQNFTFQMKLEKRCKCRIKFFEKSFEKWLWNLQNMFTKLYLEKQHWNWQKNKKLLYKEKSTIAKLFFSNENRKKVQM